MVGVPADLPVMTTGLLMLLLPFAKSANVVLLIDHVPPAGVPVNCTVAPMATKLLPLMDAGTAGGGYTFTTACPFGALLTQVPLSTLTNVYVVVDVTTSLNVVPEPAARDTW